MQRKAINHNRYKTGVVSHKRIIISITIISKCIYQCYIKVIKKEIDPEDQNCVNHIEGSHTHRHTMNSLWYR